MLARGGSLLSSRDAGGGGALISLPFSVKIVANFFLRFLTLSPLLLFLLSSFFAAPASCALAVAFGQSELDKAPFDARCAGATAVMVVMRAGHLEVTRRRHHTLAKALPPPSLATRAF